MLCSTTTIPVVLHQCLSLSTGIPYMQGENNQRFVMLFKILHNMVEIALPNYITPLTHATVTRRHNSRLNTHPLVGSMLKT